MAFLKEIKKYDVAYYGGGQNSTGYKYRAIVGLRQQDGKLLGAAYFHRDPTTMPATDDQTSSGYVWCHYSWEHFAQILDLLRNEKPVHLRYVAGGWKIASVTTAIEPVGEGENP